MAVIAFIFSIYSIMMSYQPDFFSATIFFSMASLAAISFAATFLIGIYLGTAGAVFVGAKALAANMRIEGGGVGGRGSAIRR